jgi:hypothetical protein
MYLRLPKHRSLRSSLDGNTSNSTTTSLATQTKNGGYGVFMWYDLHGTNETAQLSAGTQTLYGEPTVLSGTLQSWTQGTNCDALSDYLPAILQEQVQN